MGLHYIILRGINIYFKAAFTTIAALFFIFSTQAQSNDSTNKKKIISNLILGFKINVNGDFYTPEPRISSILGVRIKPFKTKKLSVTYRNFFTTEPKVKDTLFGKNIGSLQLINIFNFEYRIPSKNNKNYFQIGVGLFHERRQLNTDQFIFIRSPHNYGIDLSIYSRLKWLNIGFRHQIGIIHDNSLFLLVNNIYRFGLCFEIPIHL